MATYQATVLQAQADVETGLAAFLESQAQIEPLKMSVVEALEAVFGVAKLVEEGRAAPLGGGGGLGPSTTLVVALNTLVQQQNLLAQTQGNIAQGLITTYLGLGGGWEIRCQPQDNNGPVGPLASPPPMIPPQNEVGPEEAVPAPPPIQKRAVPAPSPPDEWADSN